MKQRINEREQVVQEYEASRCIPNQQILGKMERALGKSLAPYYFTSTQIATCLISASLNFPCAYF